MDSDEAVKGSNGQGVTAVRIPWSTVMILLAGIFLILTYA
jgi:hypothetical protein